MKRDRPLQSQASTALSSRWPHCEPAGTRRTGRGGCWEGLGGFGVGLEKSATRQCPSFRNPRPYPTLPRLPAVRADSKIVAVEVGLCNPCSSTPMAHSQSNPLCTPACPRDRSPLQPAPCTALWHHSHSLPHASCDQLLQGRPPGRPSVPFEPGQQRYSLRSCPHTCMRTRTRPEHGV